MKLTKHVLREAARRVLEGRGDSVRLKPGMGIVSGARLLATASGSEPRTVSVRTSHDRELGLMRNESGDWTISQVDEVLVAAPSDDKTYIEVMSFKPKVLIDVFSDALDKRPNLKEEYWVPLFIPLDDKRSKRTGAVIAGLKEKCTWRKTITPDEEMLRKGAEHTSTSSFIGRVKREFAKINGVDVSKVAVEFRILA